MTATTKATRSGPKLKTTSQETSPVTNQTVEELAQVVEQLIGQMVVLQRTIDDLGIDLQWAFRHQVVQPLPVPSIISLPRDPLVAQVNSVPPEIVRRLRDEMTREAESQRQSKQSSLW